MRTAIMITLLIASLNTAQATEKTYGVTKTKSISNRDVTVGTVSELAQFLQPSLSDKSANEIATSVMKYSKEINLDWKLFVSILFQESSLQLDPQNCYNNELHPLMIEVKVKKGKKIIKKMVQKAPKKCIDYGIAQINFKTWGEELDLDKEKLLTDVDYSIKAASKILFYYKHAYGKKDQRWHLRYHSATPEHKNEYGRFIGGKVKKINRFIASKQ